MKKIRISLLILLSNISIIFAKNVLHFYPLGNFHLENGDSIVNCRVAYRTFGTLNRDSSNVVIYPTWFGGTSDDISHLIGPDNFIDSSGFFIICIDAFGNGVSSSPSNSPAQPGQNFPEFSINDLVHAQHSLLAKYFGFKHIYSAVGGSMGSMQVFEWLVTYPNFIQKAVPYVCSPQLTSYDLLYIQTQLNIIEKGWKYGMPDSVIMQNLQLTQALMATTPQHRLEQTSRTETPEFIRSFFYQGKASFTVSDWHSQLLAMKGHDIARYVNGSLKQVANKIKTNLFIIVSKTDHIVNPAPALQLARYLGCPKLILENNCGHLAIGCEKTKCSQAIKAFLQK